MYREISIRLMATFQTRSKIFIVYLENKTYGSNQRRHNQKLLRKMKKTEKKT